MGDQTSRAACEPATRPRRGSTDVQDLDLAAGMLKALAHPVRLRMTELIHAGGGDLCVCEIEREFDLTQPTITHHLKILREAGLIRSRKEGPWVRHTTESSAFERLRAVIDTLATEPA